jgi:hypothetical protein
MTKEVFLTTQDGIEYKTIDLPLSAWQVMDNSIIWVRVATNFTPADPLFFFYDNAVMYLHENQQKIAI